ncbi:MAG: hypothetical protein IPI49_08700 [Myxococcales bacterium]|nr:hypothetical protein [Myxococcales bacterium]
MSGRASNVAGASSERAARRRAGRVRAGLVIATGLLLAAGACKRGNPATEQDPATPATPATPVTSVTPGAATTPVTPGAATTPVTPGAALGEGEHHLRVDGRELLLHVPAAATATLSPLVVYLHHLGGDGSEGEGLFGLRTLSQERGYVYAVPRSLATGREPAWNATDACCEPRQVTDDSAYLVRVLAELRARVQIDPRRIYLVGHSNGGFMSYRFACDHAELVAGIASIAGAMWRDVTRCRPSSPVSILHVHGTADATIRIDGGVFRGGVYPSAQLAVSSWAGFNRCRTPAVSAPVFTLSTRPAQATPTTYTGCAEGTEVALWSLAGADHFPLEGKAAGAAVLDWLWAHPKP